MQHVLASIRSQRQADFAADRTSHLSVVALSPPTNQRPCDFNQHNKRPDAKAKPVDSMRLTMELSMLTWSWRGATGRLRLGAEFGKNVLRQQQKLLMRTFATEPLAWG
jgi:hypothetical protein